MDIQKFARTARSVFSLNRQREFDVLCRMLSLKPDDMLLDIGSGDGFWTAQLGQRCRNVFGLEPDDTLRTYAETFFAHPNVIYLEGTAENLPFSDAHFSKIISISCFEHFTNQETAMKEIRRILKPEGIVALSVDSLLPENSSQSFREWHSQKHYVTCYFTVDELTDMFQRNGLIYDAQATTTIFHSRLAGQLREIYIRHTKVLLPLFPIFYAGVRLGDSVFNNQPGQIVILRALG